MREIQAFEGLYLSIGLHPSHANISEEELTKVMGMMQSALNLPKVVGFGEVGLDDSKPRVSPDQQERLLRRLLEHFRGDICARDLVVQVHCRSDGDLDDRLRAILLDYLSSSTEVQVHFFTESWEDVMKWTQALAVARVLQEQE